MNEPTPKKESSKKTHPYEKCLLGISFIAVLVVIFLGWSMREDYNKKTDRLIAVNHQLNEKEFFLESLDLDVKGSSLVIDKELELGLNAKINIPPQTLSLKLKESSQTNSLLGTDDNFLETHYTITNNWLTFWLTTFAMLLAIFAIIVPFLGRRWFKKQEEEIQRKFEEMKEAEESAKESARRAQAEKEAIDKQQAEKIQAKKIAFEIIENAKSEKYVLAETLYKKNESLFDNNSKFEIAEELFYILINKNIFNKKDELFNKMISYNIDKAKCYMLWGCSYLKEFTFSLNGKDFSYTSSYKKLSIVLKKLKISEELNNQNSELYLYLGDVYNLLGDEKNAIAAHSNAIKLNSRNIFALNSLAAVYINLYTKKNKNNNWYLSEAEKTLEKAINLDASLNRSETLLTSETRGLHFSNYAMILMYNENYNLAKHFAEKAYSINLTSILNYNSLIFSYIFNGLEDEAIKIFKTISDTDLIYDENIVNLVKTSKKLIIGSVIINFSEIRKELIIKAVAVLEKKKYNDAKELLNYYDRFLVLFDLSTKTKESPNQ